MRIIKTEYGVPRLTYRDGLEAMRDHYLPVVTEQAQEIDRVTHWLYAAIVVALLMTAVAAVAIAITLHGG